MIKRLSLIIFLSLFVFSFFAQVPTVSAQNVPVTPPITTPINSFNLTGKVTYKQLGRLMGNMQRLMPAKDVMVKIVNFFDHSKKYQTTTNEKGEYRVNLPVGLYQIEVSDTRHTFFVPPVRVERIKNIKSHSTANFEGLLFPQF